MSVSLSGCPLLFLAIKVCGLYLRALDAAAGHGFKSSDWQYNISVHPSVWSSAGLLRFFLSVFNSFNNRDDYYYYYYYHCGGLASLFIYPHTGVQRTPVGSSRDYVSVCLSVGLSVSSCLRLSLLWFSASIFGDQSARTVIERSACGFRLWGQIP